MNYFALSLGLVRIELRLTLACLFSTYGSMDDKVMFNRIWPTTRKRRKIAAAELR